MEITLLRLGRYVVDAKSGDALPHRVLGDLDLGVVGEEGMANATLFEERAFVVMFQGRERGVAADEALHFDGIGYRRFQMLLVNCRFG